MTNAQVIKKLSAARGESPPNTDPETGIAYGVINQNKLNPEAFDTIMISGRDLGHEEAMAEAKEAFVSAYKSGDSAEVRDWCREYISRLGETIRESVAEFDRAKVESYDDPEVAWGEFEDAVSDSVASCDESGPWLYESHGLVIQTSRDGDLFVVKSPFVTACRECSPCAPCAGDLSASVELDASALFLSTLKTIAEEDGYLLTYALPLDWFDEESPAPYKELFKIEGNAVLKEKVE